MSTVTTIAQWMLATVGERRLLHQTMAAHSVRQQFGDDFVYLNERGDLTLMAAVLSAFTEIAGDTVVWDPVLKAWAARDTS